MNKFKMLSDSSSSDSEEEHKQPHFLSKPVNYYSPVKNTKERNNSVQTDKEQVKSNSEFSTSRPQNIKRKHSFGDSEHEEKEGHEFPKKFSSSNTKAYPNFHGKEISSSESDEQNAACHFAPDVPSRSVPDKTIKSTSINDVAQKMMAKMGYVSGTGLGKFGQGRTEIVEASKQRGRRGFGLHLEGLEPSDVAWDFQKEEVNAQEVVHWIPECLESSPNIIELRKWMKKDKKRTSLDNEMKFCDPEILRKVLVCKSVFDQLESEELRKARTRSNPFETIRGVIFQNRAGMKMANMDACFDFMFSKPVDESGAAMVGPNELLYFADICAGPGGFSEYVLWRKKWECKGFGFTLKGSNDFRLDEFFAGPPETFETHYGVNGINGNGDIYVPENLREFHRFVLANTENHGVHFVMADGGFSVDGNENIQEILSKRLYLCQFLCALLILRQGGHFVCKLFDIFTPFSVGLVYLMYRTFRKVSIHKPNTSRPANSERYIICKWRREGVKDVCDYLFEVNCFLEQLGMTSDVDVSEVVSQDILESDRNFFEYIRESNNRLGERQIIHLAKIKAFAQNVELHETRQSEFRRLCLEFWKVPDKARSAPCRVEPNTRFTELMQGTIRNFLNNAPVLLEMNTLNSLENVFDFHFVVCCEVRAEQQVGLFLGLGRSNIYHLDMRTSKWSKLDVTLELPADTLIYGELIPELKGEGKAQRKIMCLHIIDALYLGGRDVRDIHFEDRMQLAKKLCKAVSKPSRSDYTPVRAKEVWRLKDIDTVLDRLIMKNVKGFGGMQRICYQMDDGRHLLPSGLLLLKTIADPWVTAFSKSQQRLYYFNVKNQNSSFSRVSESIANFKYSFAKRIFWSWEKGVKLVPDQEGAANSSKVHGYTIGTFVQGRLNALMHAS